MTPRAQPYPLVAHDADQASKLDLIARSGACEAGRVMALDFAAVRAAMGDLWVVRSADVHIGIEQEIRRQVSPRTIFLRISDCEYLVCFIDVQWAAAQALAFSIMEALLQTLLEKSDAEYMTVRCVSSITADGLKMHTLSRAILERRLTSPEQSTPQHPPASTLIETPAERLSLDLEPQDIVHLQSGLTIGTRLSIGLYKVGSPKILNARDECSLSTSSLLQATLQAVETLQGLMDRSRRPAIFVLPLFIQAVTNSRGRSLIVDELRRFRSFDQRRLIVEITGIEPGTHSSRLMEACGLLRPFCRAVTGRAQLERSALNALSGARLAGVHFSARDLGASPSQRAAGLLAAGQSARNLAPMVMAVDLPDADALNICTVAGFTHATVPARET